MSFINFKLRYKDGEVVFPLLLPQTEISERTHILKQPVWAWLRIYSPGYPVGISLHPRRATLGVNSLGVQSLTQSLFPHLLLVKSGPPGVWNCLLSVEVAVCLPLSKTLILVSPNEDARWFKFWFLALVGRRVTDKKKTTFPLTSAM